MFRFVKHIGAFALLIFAVSCNSNETKRLESGKEEGSSTNLSAGLQQVAWLEGNWMDTVTYGFKSVPSYILEQWTVYPDSLSGIGMMLKAGDTTVTERLCIRVVNGKLTYIASPIGQAMISFPMVSDSAGVLVFENPINDFPSKISYSKLSAGSMKVELGGYNQGLVMNLPMTFVKD